MSIVLTWFSSILSCYILHENVKKKISIAIGESIFLLKPTIGHNGVYLLIL